MREKKMEPRIEAIVPEITGTTIELEGVDLSLESLRGLFSD